MIVSILSFTDTGFSLARTIEAVTGGKAEMCSEGKLYEWTEKAFESADAIIYVGAAGIAVRAIAPFVRSKIYDPAVIVIDETGKFVVPILSGHIGGANEIAIDISGKLGAVPVITTATDRHNVFAVDTWAKHQMCKIANPEMIKKVSMKLLSGDSVKYYSEFKINGDAPERVIPGDRDFCDFALTIHTIPAETLLCVPSVVTLGIGCRKGISEAKLSARIGEFINKNNLLELSVCKVCSIDLKQNETGLMEVCDKYGWPLKTFSAECLREAVGTFSKSEFVMNTVGVDNVCERSAVLGSGGKLIISKDAGDGVTIAAACSSYLPEWNW